MFDVPFGRAHTLSKRRGDRGAFYGLEGLFVGPVPLLDCEIIGTGRRYFTPRPLAALNRDLERCYGLPVDAGAIMGGIGAVARALNDSDPARACIAAVFLRLPEIPERSTQALMKCAMLLAESGLLDLAKAQEATPVVKFNPYHDEAGRFTTAQGASAGGAAQKPKPKDVQIATGPGIVHSGESSPHAHDVEYWINRVEDLLMGRPGEKGDKPAAEEPARKPRFHGDNLGPELDEGSPPPPPPRAPPFPPILPRKDEAPSDLAERERQPQDAKLQEDVGKLVKEHDDKKGLPLTRRRRKRSSKRRSLRIRGGRSVANMSKELTSATLTPMETAY